MSGELVLSPIALPVAVVGGVVVLTGSVASAAAVGIKALIESRIEAERQEAECEKARITDWRKYQQGQFDAMEEARQQVEQVQQVVRHLTAQTIKIPAEVRRDSSQKRRGYLQSENPLNETQLTELLDEISKSLNRFPDSLRALSSFQALTHQRDSLVKRMHSRDFPAFDEIESLRNTLTRTLTYQKQQLVSKQRGLELQLGQTKKLLEQVLVYQRLAFEPRHKDELKDLERHLFQYLQTVQVSPGMITTLEGTLQNLTKSIDEALAMQALRPVLADSITHHLNDMGYHWLQTLDQVTDSGSYIGRVQIPGGEQVQVALHNNGELAFKLSHEETSLEELSDSERLNRLRSQESRWCSDVPELLRRLAGEGLTYQVRFARDIPEQSIEVVRVEGVDEILEAEERARFEQDHQQRRHPS